MKKALESIVETLKSVNLLPKHGKLTLSFRDGKLIGIFKGETFIPPE